MRVAFNSETRNSMADIERASSELLKWQRQVSSGRRIQTASDDPAGSVRAIGEHAQISTLDQYLSATDSVDSRLTVVDSVLSDVVEQLTSARSTITGVQGSIATAAQRESAARNLEGIKSSLLTDVNQTYRGSYIFSGSAATTRPYVSQPDGTVSSYQGDANPTSVDTGEERSVQTTFDGSAVFKGNEQDDIFTALDKVIAAVRSGDQQGMADGLDRVGRAFDRAVSTQSGVGIDLKSLGAERTQLTAMKQAASERLSRDESANMAEAISNLSQADTAYQAALGAFGARSKLSLMDYLK